MNEYVILDKIKEVYINKNGKNTNQYFYLIKDKYGVCKIFCQSWNKKKITTIESSIDKTEYFINQSKEIHGDYYDYSLVVYVNTRTKVKIICPVHEEIFEQTPNSHLKGSGCKKCYNQFRRSQTIKLTHKDFERRSAKIHGEGKFIILSEYINNRATMKFKCTYGHIYKQKASQHLSGVGCPFCFGLYKTHQDFLKEIKLKDNNEFEYLDEYSKAHIKISIRHISCGFCFKRSPAAHLQSPSCPKCSRINKGLKRRSGLEKFQQQSDVLHFSQYKVLGEYKTSVDEILILHLKCGNTFLQKPTVHLQGSGCPICAKELMGWNKSKFTERCNRHNNGLGIFYIIRCFNDTEEFYKLGITGKSIKKRYSGKSSLPYKYEIVQEIHDKAEIVWTLEILLKRFIKNQNMIYNPTIPFVGGKTECYSILAENITIISTNL